MPISIDEYREPKWTKIRERYPMSPDKKDRYIKFEDDPRSFRDGQFKQAGYNPNHNSIRVERIRLDSDEFTLKPY